MIFPIPFLLVNDDRGLSERRFNTIRLGVSWSKRLKERDRVLLAYRYEIIGSAIVDKVEIGPRDEVLRTHAESNHIELALRREKPSEYDPARAFDRRVDSARKNYGMRTFESARSATAIYMRRTR